MNNFKKDFAIFILSHGRANDIKTVDTLKRGHYTGDWYVVIDDEDNDEDLYRQKFGDKITVYSPDKTDSHAREKFLRSRTAELQQ